MRAVNLNNPLLIAVWPGMGNVAMLGGGSLVDSLGATPGGVIPSEPYFKVDHIDIKNGLATPGRLPRNMFFIWEDPAKRHDLVIFVGEAQPQTGGRELCETILDRAEAMGVKRVFTFAALGSQVSPADEPTVYAAATTDALLDDLTKVGAEVLLEGQISGLNGALIGAAAQRGMEGACVLGEIPFYAVGVPNPRASLAVVRLFERLSGIDLDTSVLERAADAAEPRLLSMQKQITSGTDDDESESWSIGIEEDHEEEGAQPSIDVKTRRQIEDLFEHAESDRSLAVKLKRLLDEHGVFGEYEDRFLDLFRKTD
jgi:hypothetical protein